MEKILLINLKKFGDIFQSGHLVSSIRSLHPNAQIDILCFEESMSATKTLVGITNISRINRKKITSFFKNNIYSDGMAFNEFEKSLKKVIANKYTRIINYSNDRVSTYLASYISSILNADVAGIHFNSKNSVQHSNNFSIVLNDILTTSALCPLNFNDTYHYLCGIEANHKQNTKIKSNPAHDKTASENFDRLRASKKNGDQKIHIIGVQLCTSSKTKNIPKEILTQTLERFLDLPNFIPILLNAPTQEERNLVKEINQKLDNRLVSVEADFIALPSVLKGIDLLLTPDTSIKHMADLVNTPCLEISLGEAPFLKQGTINPKSAIISLPANLRVFKEGVEDSDIILKDNKSLHPELIIHTISALLGENLDIEFNDNQDSKFCTYRPVKLLKGISYIPVSGPYSEVFECRRILSRSITLRLTDLDIDSAKQEAQEVYQLIHKKFDSKTISQILNEEKYALSDLTKDLLSTLRSLIQTQEDRRKGSCFVEALEKLISHCFDNNFSSLATLFFRAKLESLNASSLEENFTDVEALLYELKSNLQKCFNVLNELNAFDKNRVQVTPRRPEGNL